MGVKKALLFPNTTRIMNISGQHYTNHGMHKKGSICHLALRTPISGSWEPQKLILKSLSEDFYYILPCEAQNAPHIQLLSERYTTHNSNIKTWTSGRNLRCIRNLNLSSWTHLYHNIKNLCSDKLLFLSGNSGAAGAWSLHHRLYPKTTFINVYINKKLAPSSPDSTQLSLKDWRQRVYVTIWFLR